jgi:hypothetical protein
MRCPYHLLTWSVNMDKDTLFTLIQDRMEMDELLDLLGIGIGQLCLRLRAEILESREEIEGYIDQYDDLAINESGDY